MYARFLLFLGRPRPACGGRGSGFLACPAPDTAVPVRTRRRVEPAPAVMAMVVAGRWQIREARQHVCSVGAGRGTPAAGTGCWQTGMARSVPVRRDPGACLPDKAGVCLSGSRGGQSDADTGVGRPESGGADECRVAFGRMPGLPGYAWVSQPNRAVGLPERGACCGYGRSAVLARKNEGSPERLPSPSKINP